MTPSIFRIAFASFIGTAIEFYDFYIYGLAVAMVIGPIFFPGSYEDNNYRLLDGYDGWNYLAVPITADKEF